MFSLVFDDEDENKLSYTEIHQQYKTLVSTVFGPDVDCNMYMFPKCPIFMHCLINMTH